MSELHEVNIELVLLPIDGAMLDPFVGKRWARLEQ
jgi:hypothetical protein